MGDAVEPHMPHVPLTKCRVLYIGRAAPKNTPDGIEAIQKPLFELYTKDDRQSNNTDIDAMLTVLTSGLLMEPVNPLDPDVWLPIQNLRSCAAVKAVVHEQRGGGCSELNFVPVDAHGARGSQYPPIFSCVMGRSNGLPLTDCFAFICQSDESALVTVQATMHAYGNKGGWASDRPNKRVLEAAGKCRKDEIVISGQMDDTPSEFFEKPPLSGFFYTPSPSLIQKFVIHGEACEDENTYGGSYSARSPYIPERSVKPAVDNSPAVVMFDNEQDFVFVEEFDGRSPIQIPPPELSRFMDAGPSQAIALNPYLMPTLDPAPAVAAQPQAAPPQVARALANVVPQQQQQIPKEAVIVPIAQQKIAQAPRQYGNEQPIYQTRLPRSNIGVDQTYINNQAAQPRRGRDTTTAIIDNPRPESYFPPPKPVVEEVYAQRLPPPTQVEVPTGAKLFDSNFILQQSDTDKARIADVKNFQGYPTPGPVNIAEFGY